MLTVCCRCLWQNTFGRVVTWGAVTANGADVFWNPAGARWLVVDVSQVLQAWRRLYVLWAVHRIHLRTIGRHRRQNLSRGGQDCSITEPERKQRGSESGAFHGTPPSSPFAFLCCAFRSPPTPFHCNRLRVWSHAQAVGLAQSEACHTGFFSTCRQGEGGEYIRGSHVWGRCSIAFARQVAVMCRNLKGQSVKTCFLIITFNLYNYEQPSRL